MAIRLRLINIADLSAVNVANDALMVDQAYPSPLKIEAPSITDPINALQHIAY
jgi:hypothetical protein